MYSQFWSGNMSKKRTISGLVRKSSMISMHDKTGGIVYLLNESLSQSIRRHQLKKKNFGCLKSCKNFWRSLKSERESFFLLFHFMFARFEFRNLTSTNTKLSNKIYQYNTYNVFHSGDATSCIQFCWRFRGSV